MKNLAKTTYRLTTQTLILACTVGFPFLSEITLSATEYTYENGGTITEQQLSGTYSNPEEATLTFSSYHTIKDGGTIFLEGEGEKRLGQVNGPGTIVNGSSGSTIFDGHVSTNISLTGSGKTTFGGGAQGSSLSISGSGNAEFNGYTYFTDITLSGDGDVSFAQQVGGTNLTISGSGSTHFQGNLAVSGNVSVGGSGNTTFSKDINWANSFTISSSGYTLFDETSHFNGLGTLNITGEGITEIQGFQQNNIGTINIDESILVLNQDGGYITGAINVSEGSTLVMLQDNQTASWGSTITLNEGASLIVAGTTQTINTLCVVGNATIDMGIEYALSTVTINNLIWGENSSLTLIGYDPETVGDKINITINGVTYSSSNLPTNVIIDNGSAVIPEPSTYAAFGGALLLGLVALRRRKN